MAARLAWIPLMVTLAVSCGGKSSGEAEPPLSGLLGGGDASSRDAYSDRTADVIRRDVSVRDASSADVLENDDASSSSEDGGSPSIGAEAGAKPSDSGTADPGRGADDDAAPVDGAALVSLTITASRTTIGQGGLIGLLVEARDSDGRLSDVTNDVVLTSSDSSVFQISGIAVLARSPGVATITARLGGRTAVIDLTAVANDILSIEITVARSTPTLTGEDCFVNNTTRFRATAMMASGRTQDVSAQATWASSKPNIIVVTPKLGGTVQCLSAGETIVSATVGGVRGELNAIVRGSSVVGYIIDGPAVVTPSSTANYRVVALYDDGRQSNLAVPATLVSSDPSVLAVSVLREGAQDPTMRGEAGINGSALLTAAYEGLQAAPLQVTVTAAALRSIAITPNALEILTPAFGRLQAIGTYEDGTVADLSSMVTWSHEERRFVGNGIVTARATGTTPVTATLGNITSPPAQITVGASPPSTIDVAPLTIRQGFTRKLCAGATYPSGYLSYTLCDELAWSSANPAIASIQAGVLSALQPGTTTFQAGYAGATSASTSVEVLKAATLLGIELSYPDLHLGVGQEFWMTVDGRFQDGLIGGDVDDITNDTTMTTTNPRVATVGDPYYGNGWIRAVSVGTTVLTAAVRGHSVTTRITVDPAAP